MKREIETFDDLTSEEIKSIAREEFNPSHKLILSTKGKNWIVEDISDYLEYGYISHTIQDFDSFKELKKYFKDNDGLEIDKDTKNELISESQKMNGKFYLAIKDYFDNPSDFSIKQTFNDALSFLSENDESLRFIEDEKEIINKYAEEYLKAGYMKNGKYSHQREVYQNFFNIEDLARNYISDKLNLDTFSKLNENLATFTGIDLEDKAVSKVKQVFQQI